MNIGLILLMIIGGAVGVFSTLYILVSLPATIIFKIIRKVSHGTRYLFPISPEQFIFTRKTVS